MFTLNVNVIAAICKEEGATGFEKNIHILMRRNMV
jgi:hypothetical protein